MVNEGISVMVNVTLKNNICWVEPLAPLTKDDFIYIASRIDPVIEREGALAGLVIRTPDFPGWESFSDAIEHFRFIKNHHQFIHKVALVTDAKVADILPAVVQHFVKAEVKHFAFDEVEQVMKWLG